MNWQPREDISPMMTFDRLRSGWMVIVWFTLIGGLLGFAASWLFPPRFQASAEIEIGIDYGRTVRLSNYDESVVAERVREFLLSDAMLRKIILAVDPAAGSIPTEAEVIRFRSMLELSLRGDTWILTVEDREPSRAAEISNQWATISLGEFSQAIQQAWKTVDLQSSILRLDCVLEGAPESTEAVWSCPEADRVTREELVNGILEATGLAKGLLPGMYIVSVQSASPPEHPSVYGRGGLILSGLGAGFVLGLIYIFYFKQRG
jgi:uncharacterized protein involved in exopolysaccharide biosynthesis